MKIPARATARKESGQRGGNAPVEGNARLTGSTSLILLVLFAIEVSTVIIGVKTNLTMHVVVGLLLVPPLLVKIASVSWRFIKYYRHDEAFRRKGPPTPILRILGPLLLAATLVLFISGIILLLAPSAFGGPHGTMFYIHDGSFYIWLLLVLAHLVGHARDLRRLAAIRWPERISPTARSEHGSAGRGSGRGRGGRRLRGGERVPRADQPALVGQDNQLCPVPGAELGENPRDMRLYGQRA